MKVEDVYDKFEVPENLRVHMLRVTMVAMTIVNGWNGHDLDKEIVRKGALVHDLANIVKFKLEDGSPLKEKQAEMINKYGSDDHLATEKMLRELGIDDQLIEIVQGKSFGNAIEVEKSGSWPLKILFYSDMRVTPSGVVDLETRLNDVVTRLERYRDDPKKGKLMESVREIESELQKMTNTNLSAINDNMTTEDQVQLLETEV